MHPVAIDDIVSSVGRIRVVQEGRKRYISFSMAKVINVGPEGITVAPIGKRATFICRPEDVELVEEANHDLDQTPNSRESAAQQAEHNKGLSALPVEPVTETPPQYEPGGIVPLTGTIAVASGEVVSKPKPKQSLKELRDKKRSAEGEPSKPKPRPRRRRR